MLDAIRPVLQLVLSILVDLFMGKLNEPDTAVYVDTDDALRNRLECRVFEHKNNLNPNG